MDVTGLPVNPGVAKIRATLLMILVISIPYRRFIWSGLANHEGSGFELRTNPLNPGALYNVTSFAPNLSQLVRRSSVQHGTRITVPGVRLPKGSQQKI